ncbi:MAG: succinate dehydrogenase [Thermoguttaceae bacterium]|jgi:succinate dehydrogenase / fumarate reductase cytochrome b subunit
MDIPFLASIFGKHEFVVRRLHSLLGLIPIGGFLCFHLATNASILDGSKTFQMRVNIIHQLGPTTLSVLEWGTILLPILFHGVIGLIIVSRGKRNLRQYPYLENWRYTLQRVTGVVAMAFILFHVFQMHGWFRCQWWTMHVARPFGGARFDWEHAAASVAAVLEGSNIFAAIYFVGIVSCVYHLANGLWTMGITWGVWTTPRAQRWANIPCALFGLALLTIGLGALFGFANFPLR